MKEILTLDELIGGSHATRLREVMLASSLSTLNATTSNDAIKEVLHHIKEFSGIESVAVRLQEGDDYPYYAVEGFSEEFVKRENFIRACDPDSGTVLKDSKGTPTLECMCGNIIQGRFDSTFPFFTEYGSFWTNNTTELLASTTESDRQSGTRNYCNQVGYESVAIIPLRVNEDIVGTLQLNDHRAGMFSQEIIELYEELSRNIVIDLQRKVAESHFRSISENNADGIIIIDNQGIIRYINPEGIDLFGKSEEYLMGCNFGYPLVTGSTELDIVNRQENPIVGEMRLVETMWDGKPAYMASIRDISERKKLEERLRQSETMSVVGELAAGVAHDFNNQLQGILGCSQILLDRTDLDDSARYMAKLAYENAEVAAGVTKQLLLYSGKATIIARPIKVSGVIDNVISMLEHTKDKRIDVNRHYGVTNDFVIGDTTQLQSAVLNLAINAGHAMPEGGQLDFSTQKEELDEDFCKGKGITPGKYISLYVTDTGVGMDEGISSRIFEPYFTTRKDTGGTGLGLAAVYGTIVKTHKGWIDVASSTEEPSGTTFKIYLPRYFEQRKEQVSVEERVSGSGYILFVDDEKSARIIAQHILPSLGYELYAAETGREAIDHATKREGNIDLVVLDMNLEDMNGTQIAQALRGINPDMRILLSTGYTGDESFNSELFTDYIEKPWDIVSFSHKIREVMQG